MYQQGRDRRKTNVNTVGSRHGDSFWQAESANTGLKLLTSMGWKQGDGLGKEGQGTTNAIKAKRKSDNSGIGAKAGDADQHGFAQVATANFNDLLKRLNEANANNETVKQPDSSDSEDDSIRSGVTAIGRSMARNGLYGRFRAAKDVQRYSSDAKAEIFGHRKSAPAAVASPTPSQSTASKSPEPESESSIITTTATVSMADYFAQKARARAAAAAGISTQSTAAISATTTSSSRGFSENDQTAYYDMISSRAQGSNARRAGLGAHSTFTQEYHSVTVKQETIVKEECIKQEVVVKEELVVIKEETEESSEKSSKRDRKRVKREEAEEPTEAVDEEAAKRERKRLKKERKAAKKASKQYSDDE